MSLASRTRVALIVLNWEGAAVIRPCLQSICAAMGPDDELIVVDNASSDESAELIAVEFPTVRLIRRGTNNFIFGLNDGLDAAVGAQYVAFLNNDIVVEREFVERSLACFTSDDVFAVCPRILDRNGGEQGARTAGFWKHGLIFFRPLPHSSLPTDCFFAVGGQSFFRRDLLVEIGSIDELFWPMYHEDIELAYRAWKRGWKIRYAPDSVVHHLGHHSTNKRFTKSQLRSFVRQNEYLTVWKNVTDVDLLAWHVVLIPARLAAATLKRDWPTLVGFGRAIRRLPRVRAARRAAKKHFRLSDREVLRRISTASINRSIGSGS